MGDGTAIQWSDATWNPILGCSRVSPGCERCYAEVTAARNERMGVPGYEPGLVRLSKKGEPRWTGEVRFLPERLDQPLRWKRPRRIFVNSMSDLFHEVLPREAIAAVLGVICLTGHHTYQILTKRARRMRTLLSSITIDEALDALTRVQPPVGLGRATSAAIFASMRAQGRDPDWSGPLCTPPWAWFGVSVEDQQRADERLPELMLTPAAVRWVSLEPLLGDVDIRPYMPCLACGGESSIPVDGGGAACGRCLPWTNGLPSRGPFLDWVVMGGESGRRARPMNVARARRVLSDCRSAQTPAFMKQLGVRPVDGDWQAGVYAPEDRRAVAAARELGIPEGGTPPNLILLRGRKAHGDPSQWPDSLRELAVREWPR